MADDGSAFELALRQAHLGTVTCCFWSEMWSSEGLVGFANC